MNNDLKRPLADVVVLDLVSGPLATIGRTLAEMGAEVIRVEPKGGARDRADGDVLAFAARNNGKRSFEFDPEDENSRTAFHALLDRADIFINDMSPHAGLAIDSNSIHSKYPGMTILSVSDFGIGNDFSDWQATDPVLHAISGELARSGLDGRAPLLPPGSLGTEAASSQAAMVVLFSYLNRLSSGKGDHLNFSTLDGTSHALDPGYGMGGSAAQGKLASELPRGRPPKGFQYPILRCKNGFVRICVLAPRQWQGMFKWMGSPERFADPKYNKIYERFGDPELNPMIEKHFMNFTRDELERDATEYGVPLAAVLTLEEALKTEHMVARKAIVELDLPGGKGRTTFANGVMEIDGERMGPMGPAPELGDFDAIRSGQSLVGRAKLGFGGARPLEGLKVLDLGIIIVGADQGRLLADQGADVIKVEAKAFPDGGRQTIGGEAISLGFAVGHRNKRSLGINLRDPKGKALFLELAKEADVILSNFKPGTLASLGLDYDTVSKVNPRIIMGDSSAFGPTGPWSRRMGYGPLVRANAGLTDMWKYPGDDESFSDAITVYPDHTAARYGLLGVLGLLVRRAYTNVGGVASTAQAEIMLGHFTDDIARIGMGVTRGKPDAPWGVFPTKGDDDWAVVTVRGNDDWAKLCTVMGRDDLAKDPALADRDGRIANSERVDAAVTDWLAGQTAHDAMMTLQKAGVPAAQMLRVSEMAAFDYYKQRNFTRVDSHPLIAEPFRAERSPVLSELMPEPPNKPAPQMGEHTREVVKEWLNLPDSEIEALVEQEILEPLAGEKTAA